ncbi:MAG: hypothetical protein FWG47_04005 [Propionibacteriaceae bacterium]|nr:hypothetical protein [Propionibacteriaceae bacterium]
MSKIRLYILGILITIGMIFTPVLPAVASTISGNANYYSKGSNIFTNTESLQLFYTGTAQITGTTWYGTEYTVKGNVKYTIGSNTIGTKTTASACNRNDGTKRTASIKVTDSLNPFDPKTKYKYTITLVDKNQVVC